MVKLEDIIWDDSKTSDYLVENCKIAKTTYEDISQIGSILINCFHIPRPYDSDAANILEFVINTKLDILNSIKLYDVNTNKIYGFILVGNKQLHKSIPYWKNSPLFDAIFSNCTQINGIAFIIDKRLRGKGFDKNMLLFNKSHFDKFDIVWHGVDKSLKTHNYWKRFGFKELIDDGHVKFYTKFLN